MGDLDGCLCILSKRSPSLTVMWVMKDYGIKDSWTQVTVELPVDYPDRVLQLDLRPIGYSKRNGEIFFQNNHELLWYDTEKTIVQDGQSGW